MLSAVPGCCKLLMSPSAKPVAEWPPALNDLRNRCISLHAVPILHYPRASITNFNLLQSCSILPGSPLHRHQICCRKFRESQRPPSSPHVSPACATKKITNRKSRGR